MSTLLSFAIAPTRAWAALYTRGLPADVRGERREEIDCDLWEHQRLADLEREPATSTAATILLRLIMGVPADMTWRLEAGAVARSERGTQMNKTLTMRGSFLLALGIAIVPAGLGVAVLAGNGELSSSSRAVFGSVWIAAAAAMVAGLVLSPPRPRLGIGLVAIGAAVISVMMFWIAFITVPIGAALVFLAYKRARQTGWRFRGGDVPKATA